MTALPAARLETLDGQLVALQGVSARGRLAGLAFELTVEQRYRNTSEDTLETVYTFPLPLNAVLLSLELELNGERHVAQVTEKRAAERTYEAAVDDGDSAALLEDKGNGIYAVSLANLKPGEYAVLRYRYAELLAAHRGYVRLQVPTCIAPRYGDASAARLAGPAIPGHDWLVEYPFTLQIDVDGLAGPNALHSPSHAIGTAQHENSVRVTLERNGFLDRDFVLEVAHAELRQTARIARHGSEQVVLASFTVPDFRPEHRPLRLKLLLDCSGSMQGPRIDAARRAITALLQRVDAQDRVSLTRFGSSVDQISPELDVMDARTRDALALIVRDMNADLGGTEMALAVRTVIRQRGPSSEPTDILLVTDGEIHDVDGLVDIAANARHRLFVMAIGAAPNEALARRVSLVSGGACEFVADNEDAEAAILRMVMRLRSKPRTIERIDWPVIPTWTTPLPSAVFPGETVHVMAGFSQPASGAIRVAMRDADGLLSEVRLAIDARSETADLIPRLATARRLATLSQTAATALAVEYQLASNWTSFVVVAERADAQKAVKLPKTVAMPHMVALQRVSRSLCRDYEAPSLQRFQPARLSSVASTSPVANEASPRLRRTRRFPKKPSGTSAEIRDAMLFWIDDDIPSTFASLAALLGAGDAVISGLERIAQALPGFSEAEIVTGYLSLLGNKDDESKDELPPALRDSPILTERRYRELRQRLKDVIEAT